MTTVEDLAARARELVRGRDPAILGITGSPGAGKSTLVAALLAELHGDSGIGTVAHLPMDGFHLADVELDRLGRRDRKGAPDTFDAAGYVATLRRLREDTDEIVYVPGFERQLEQPIAAALPIRSSARLVITEGNYLLFGGAWAGVREQLDEVWFCALDEAERQSRLVARHVRFGKAHDAATDWVHGVDQRNAELIEATRPRADLVVDVAGLAARLTG